MKYKISFSKDNHKRKQTNLGVSQGWAWENNKFWNNNFTYFKTILKKKKKSIQTFSQPPSFPAVLRATFVGVWPVPLNRALAWFNVLLSLSEILNLWIGNPTFPFCTRPQKLCSCFWLLWVEEIIAAPGRWCWLAPWSLSWFLLSPSHWPGVTPAGWLLCSV